MPFSKVTYTPAQVFDIGTNLVKYSPSGLYAGTAGFVPAGRVPVGHPTESFGDVAFSSLVTAGVAVAVGGVSTALAARAGQGLLGANPTHPASVAEEDRHFHQVFYGSRRRYGPMRPQLRGFRGRIRVRI